MDQILLQLKNVSKYYVNGNNVVAGLNRANITMRRGEFVAITGESGSGKSTLGHILSGILPYEDGEMYFNGSPTSHFDNIDWENYRKDHISFISQSYGILPGATVLDHILSALRLCGEAQETAREKAMHILEQVELTEVANRRAAKLSSGQKQRLSIARALAKPGDILVADEPTGNLDAENSEIVIRLLSQAARERLVIIITHEFDEVKNYATRHIRLQDGQISGDTILRERAQCPEPAVRKKVHQRLAAYVAKIQLRSRPAWCGAVLLFFALTAFAVFVFLGSFIVALDDTNTRIYDSEAFRNGDPLRIAVMRQDGEALTQEDYDAILSVSHVTHLERFGYVTDLNYYYIKDVDYEYVYINRNHGSKVDPLYKVDESITLLRNTKYIQTVPLMAEGYTFLTAGREPENFYEIVMVGTEADIGRTFDVYFRNEQNWPIGEYVSFSMTVVGVTDLGSGIYVHEDVSRMMTANHFSNTLMFPQLDPVYTDCIFLDFRDCDTGDLFHTDILWTDDTVARPIRDSEATISYRYYSKLLKDSGYYYTGYTGEALMDIYGYMGIHNCTLYEAFGVSETRFHEFLLTNERNDQASVYIQDYAYADRVMEALQKQGYLAISPFKQGSAQVDEELAAKRVQTLSISISALVAVLILQLIVLRALFGMENEAYQIFSSVGLPYKTAKNSLWIQILGFTALGQIIGLGAVLLCSSLGIQRIVNVTKYLYRPYWIMLCSVHLLASVAVAVVVIRALRKRVYPISSRKGDLNLDDEEADAV